MRAIAVAALATGLALGGLAHGADLNDPIWAQAPDRSDWANAYPAQAAQAGISGDVKLRCTATAEGALSGCAVVSESPSSQGFGAAALSLTAGMQLKPTSVSGESVAGRNIIVPVRFEPALLHPGAVVGNPDWLRRPTNDEMVQFWPAGAQEGGGKTLVQCVVTNRGLLEKCGLERETPAGHGYGGAALAMTQLFLMRPMTLDGLPVGGGQVSIPINFASGVAPTPTSATFRMLRISLFTAAPTLADMSAVFPHSEIGKVASVHVVLRCGMLKDGRLDACDALSNASNDERFVSAAQALAKDFRVLTDAYPGALSGYRIDIPFDFRDPSQPVPPLEVYDPIWLQTLNPDAVAQVYPPAALKAGVTEGRASVVCSVVHDGSLIGCSVVSEAPAGVGFGDAALQVAAIMKMNPWTRQGAPVDGARIRLPIRLLMPGAAAPALPTDTPSTPPRP
jgi:TonB family protein